ncbi:hypothetical protein V8E54_014141 [Elaphomyces granulatus]
MNSPKDLGSNAALCLLKRRVAHKKVTLIFLLELPRSIARTLTYRTPYNIDIDKSQALVSNGPNKHPGARYSKYRKDYRKDVNISGSCHSLQHRYIDKSQALVSNGPNKHPGARYSKYRKDVNIFGSRYSLYR